MMRKFKMQTFMLVVMLTSALLLNSITAVANTKKSNTAINYTFGGLSFEQPDTEEGNSVTTTDSEAEADVTDSEEKHTIKPWCDILYDFCHELYRHYDHFAIYRHRYASAYDIVNKSKEIMSNNGGYSFEERPNQFYNISDEEAYAQMQEFIFQIEHGEVAAKYFNRIYEACCNETNDNGYYSKENWDAFTKALKAAKEIYDRETDGKYSEDDLKKQYKNNCINDAYFNLTGALKNLCLTNKLFMDPDRDGEVTLKDVVKVQRYIAKLEDLNISEKMVVSQSYYGEIDLTVVTDMQKYIAKLTKLSKGTPLSEATGGCMEDAFAVRPTGYPPYNVSVYYGNYLADLLKDILHLNGYESIEDIPSY